jgi:DNA end-binding protein Ku
MGSATISFGLVSIPSKLYSATESGASISFNLLHKECGSRLKQQYLCAKEGTIVDRADMVKGYEFAKDQYVTFTPEELKELEEKSTQTIDITEFVPAEKVDPVFYDKAYYLGPDKGAEKAYRLLAKAMKASGRVALAKYAARGKMYLVMVRPTEDDRLVMQQLRYADEVRPASEVPVADTEVREQELKLALQLIEQIAHETFNPAQYEDEVRNRIQTQIERKVAGQEIAISPEEAPKAQIIDLMEALKASLGAAKKEAPAAKPSKRTEAAAEPAPKKKSSKK